MIILNYIKEISLIFGIFIGIYSINSWRREHIGKRKIELAEDTLSLFYEAKDAILHIRHVLSYGNETSDVERLEGEPDKNYEARKKASIVFIRYNTHQELFSKIHALRYRFMAQIGKDKAKPFEDLRNVINEILTSARMLSILWAKERFRTEEQEQKHWDEVEQFEKVFWDHMDANDPINPKIDAIITEIETTCNSVISGTLPLYRSIAGKLSRKKLTNN